MRDNDDIFVISEADLPSDFLTPVEGMNYGLDGYPDLDYGAGVLNPDLMPDTSQVPDGFITASLSRVADVGDFFVADTSLTDLSWLDVQEQDLDRLPKNPVDTVIPELEEAWGVNRRTDGIHLVPYHDIDNVRVVESSEHQKDLRSVMHSAWRRVASGESFDVVRQQARLAYAAYWDKLGPAFDKLADETPLLGQVYIAAANYPDCHTGRWNDHIRKVNANAAYVVAKKECGSCVLAQQGRCSAFKKEIVVQVPWASAVKKYAGGLKASGRHVPTEGNPKSRLKAAFSQESREMSSILPVVPVVTHIADTVSPEQARENLASAKADIRKVPLVTAEQRMARVEAKVAQIKSAVGRGLRGHALLNTLREAFPKADEALGFSMLASYFKEVNAFAEPKAAAYSGLSNDTRTPAASAEQAWKEILAARHPSAIDISYREAARLERLRKAQMDKLAATLDRWVEDGMLNRTVRDQILAAELDPKDGYRIAMSTFSQRQYTPLAKSDVAPAPIKVTASQIREEIRAASEDMARRAQEMVQAKQDRYIDLQLTKVQAAVDRGLRGSLLRDVIRRTLIGSDLDLARPKLAKIVQPGMLQDVKKEARKYDDKVYVAHQHRELAPTANPIHVRQIVRFAKTALEKGIKGERLNQFLSERFDPITLKAAVPEIQKIRKALEVEKPVDPALIRAVQASTWGFAQEKEIHAPKTFDPNEFVLDGNVVVEIPDEAEPEPEMDVTFGGMEW